MKGLGEFIAAVVEQDRKDRGRWTEFNERIKKDFPRYLKGGARQVRDEKAGKSKKE